MSTGEPGGLYVVGFGAGSLDIRVPVGELGSPVLPDGTKDDTVWHATAYAQNVLEQHLAGMRPGTVEDIGGNVLNMLAGLLEGDLSVQQAAMVTLHGEQDLASQRIRGYLADLGIVDLGVEAPDAQASVGIIHHSTEEADRSIRARPRRGRLSDHIDADFVKSTTHGAAVVIASSLKDPKASLLVAQNADPKAFMSVTPGSSEFAEPDVLLGFFDAAPQPDLVTLNTQEAASLVGQRGETASTIVAALATCALARHVLVTDGPRGLYLVSNGDAVYRRDAEKVPAHEIRSTLGAGDAATVKAIELLVQNKSPETVLEGVARQGALAIRHFGAHGHLPRRQRSTA